MSLSFTNCATRTSADADEDLTVEDQVDGIPEDLGDPATTSDRSAEESQADRDARDTFPIVRNEFVEQWIRYFTETRNGRRTFKKWLSRKQRYAAIIRKTIKEDGLPQDLIYLAMIESGFNPRAHSHAGAAGVWQFMPYTGKNYGLRQDHWYDERRDIIKATHAAATYLKELHQVFGSWYLAAASYNAGEGRTLRVVRENQTRNFWELIRKKKNYRSETRNYVPKIIAAKILSSDPEKYGFHNVKEEQPLVWEEVMVSGGVSLRDIASLIGTPYNDLRLMNPELRRGITPPNKDEWRVRVAPDKKDILIAKKGNLKSHKSGHFITHKLRRGQTLSHVARRYGVSTRTIMDLNQIRSARRVRAGKKLKIPVDYRGGKSKQARRSSGSSRSQSLNGNVYTVQSGDNLYDIARSFKTTIKSIKRANSLRSNGLSIGQKLRIPGKDVVNNTSTSEENVAAVQSKTYKVKKGDSLFGIANKHGVSIRKIKRLNSIRGNTIYPGQTLKIQIGQAAQPSSSYRVRRGDNLTKIAKTFGLTPKQLRSMNGLKSNTIHPGQKLKVLGDGDRMPASLSSYKVRKGDSLSKIAQKFRTSISNIRAINNLSRSSYIQVGQRLKIPE